MRRLGIGLSALALALACTGCAHAPAPDAAPSQATPAPQEGEQQMSGFYIHANGHALEVTPASSSSAEALLALLEEGGVMVSAHDYGGFEKVGSLPASLPTNDERITTRPGDVILYQGDQLTVYYGTNTWSLTRLGHIEDVDADELRDVLGDGSVELRLSLSA